MVRLILIGMAGLILFGCKPPSAHYGSGELVLNQRASQAIKNYFYVDRLYHMEISLDKRGRSAGLRYCSSGGGNCFESTGMNSLDDCNKSGKFDCSIFMVDNRVVWNGPVLSRQGNESMLVPFSGAWTMKYISNRLFVADATVEARLGRLTVTGLDGQATCKMTYSALSDTAGVFGIDCSGGRSANGRFAVRSASKLVGSGQDETGQDVRIEIDLAAGRGLTYTANATK